MPEAVVYEHGGTKVLVINKDWGGNVPMVETWAWIWGPNGPIRLDVDAAIAEAIEKVAPQYAGYNTGLKWDTLQCHTYVWKGDYPGKIGVGAEVNAWFALSAKGLVLKQAEFHESFEENPKTNRWPK